jgi:hypothetical protein
MEPDAIARNEEELRELLRQCGLQDASEAGLIAGFRDRHAVIAFPGPQRHTSRAVSFDTAVIPLDVAMRVIEELTGLEPVDAGELGPRTIALYRRPQA